MRSRIGRMERLERKAALARHSRDTLKDFPLHARPLKVVGRPSNQWDYRPKGHARKAVVYE